MSEEETIPGLQDFCGVYEACFRIFIDTWREHQPCLPLNRDTIRAAMLLTIEQRWEDVFRILEGDTEALVSGGQVIFHPVSEENLALRAAIARGELVPASRA